MLMHDLKNIRKDIDGYIQGMNKRGKKFDEIKEVIKLDDERRSFIVDVEQLKARKNTVSKEIGVKKRDGLNADELVAEMNSIGDSIKEYDLKVSALDLKIKSLLEVLPNMLNDSVPLGADEKENVEVRAWGSIDETKKTLPHWEIGTNLNIIDFERAAKVSGSRTAIFKGAGARLERALVSYLLDVHTTKHGYLEVATPYLVNSDSMYGTGQLPKFAEDAYVTNAGKHYLIPTTEVPLINMYRNEMMSVDELTKSFVGYSANFRKEAGSAGKDTKGILRQHQFKKVELVKFTKPEDSYVELEKLTNDAEYILQSLNIPYRVVMLCSGDVGFSASKTYDIEAWMPCSGGYREISSCSNCEDFQARRANIKFKRDKKSKAEFVHTLNGTGVAIGRLMIAIIENYQTDNGNAIEIPDVLIPYMGGIEKIEKNNEGL